MELTNKKKLNVGKIKFNRTMIVDNNEIDSFVSRKMIERCGFSNEIVEKKTCSTALEFLNNDCKSIEELPDFIFLDLFLPVQSGYDFLEAYAKKNKTFKNKCKVIVLSVLVDEDEIQVLLRNQNIYTLLQKPLTEESLNAIKEIHYIQTKSIRKVTEIYN